MSYYFGLYFGNTNICIAVCKNGKTEVIANSAGYRLTPSFAVYANGEISVGIAAKQLILRNADDIMTSIKDLLLDGEENKGSKLEPYDVLVLLFKSMVSIARSYCHEPDVPVVITIPLTFTPELQRILEKASAESGFRLLRIISEPAAAMLAYDLDHDKSTFNCLVYRLGGTSSDAVIFEVHEGLYREISSVHNDFGGNVLTQKLGDYVAEEFNKLYKVDVRKNRRSALKLYSAAETCKHSLSIMRSSQCFVESIYDGIDLNINVSQARFESLIVSNLNKCVETILSTLKQASLNIRSISKIVLCGGSCKIPKLQQLLKDNFSHCVFLTSIPPDETIAVGASKQAALITHIGTIAEKDCYFNILTHAIYLRKIDGDNDNNISLFHKGVIIPVSHKLTLSTNKVSTIEIYEEMGSILDSKLLAKFMLPASIEISIDTEITSNRKLKLTWTDIVTGLSKNYVI